MNLALLPMRRRLRIAAISLATALVCLPAYAQQGPDSEPPFEQDLLRLSEIFGALHFLRPLCGHEDKPSWRERMQELIDTEVVDEKRRRRFTQRFNQGYRGFSTSYRTCTNSARLALTQYIDESETIIRTVTSRYGR